eukprot:jgi/Chlat1/7907/Chrsp68S07349
MVKLPTLEDVELFRSQEMQLVQLIIPAEAAHDTVLFLGEIGMVQFKDLNPDKSAFQRTYANQVKRCDEMARRLRFFQDQMAKANMRPAPRPGLDKDLDLDELETKLQELETELLEIITNTDKLKKSHAELVEMQLVLEKAGAFFDSANDGARLRQQELESSGGVEEGMASPLLQAPPQDPKAVRLGFVAGVIAQDKLLSFERVLFRATRGNMFLKQAPIEGMVVDPHTGDKMHKVVFTVFFAGERARSKIVKICDSFNANRYPFPEDVARRRQMYAEVNARLAELHTTIEAGVRHRDSVLSTVGHSLELWTRTVHREKAIYHTLNLLSSDVTRKCLIAEGWCPTSARSQIQDALYRAGANSSATVSTVLQPIATKEMPPTFFQTNKFTECFQEIVNAYGMARYREVNPAVFTMVTFPFLFAVMFGDFGHGLLMLAAALWFIRNEKKLGSEPLNEIIAMIYGGRYCILLMAIFSVYVGLIYNECFSIPMNFFGKSGFDCHVAWATTTGCDPRLQNPDDPNSVVDVYPVGADPVWHGTRTELPFFNSLKMKMSIIMGVSQMILGIFMSLLNARYFKMGLNIWCEFVPQMLFLNALFGYLSLLIIIKWWSGSTADLYHVMIYMFLSPGLVEDENRLFPGQAGVQVLLVLIAVVCVPWMLIPKPLILRKRYLASKRGATYGVLGAADSEDDTPSSPHDDHGGHGEHFEFGEVMVHQMIHTIEFVLGAVSNTASYLRLWALSLAHAQLSAVFYDRILMLSIGYGSVPGIVVGFAVWFGVTMGVLMVMESLSAFLHALRLHWVEFMNKFYIGDGYRFVPFSFVVPQEEL